MSGFVEKTVAEQRFGASWNRHVEPVLSGVQRKTARSRLFAVLVTVVALIMVAVVIGFALVASADSFFAAPLTVSLVLALSVLALIAGWVPMLRGSHSVVAPVMSAIEAHFASLFSVDDNSAFATVLVQDLIRDGILDDSDVEVLHHHAGTYRGCRIRLVEATLSSVSQDSKKRRPAVSKANLILARVNHPMVVGGEVRIDSDRGRAEALAQGNGRLSPFQPAHRQFGSIFSVLASDNLVAAGLVTDGFAEMLLRIQQQLGNALTFDAEPSRVAVYQVQGSLTLIIQGDASSAETSSRLAAEKLARSMVMRFATVPGLVDELYGEDGPSSAFTAIDPIPPRQQSPHLF